MSIIFKFSSFNLSKKKYSHSLKHRKEKFYYVIPMLIFSVFLFFIKFIYKTFLNYIMFFNFIIEVNLIITINYNN